MVNGQLLTPLAPIEQMRKNLFLLLVALIATAAWAAESRPPITAVRFSPDGARLALAGGESVRIVAPSQNAPETSIQTKLVQVLDAAWSPDSALLAVAGGNAGTAGQVELWDMHARRAVREMKPFRDLIYAVAFSPDGKRLAVGSAEGTLRLLDAVSGETIATLTGHSGPVLCVAWAPDGGSLASGSADRSIRIWEAETGQLLRSLNNHAGAVHAVVFAPDGQTLFSAATDATVRVWVPGVGRMKRIFRGYGTAVLGLAYAPARQKLLAGVADGSARLVDAETGDILKRFGPEPESHAPWLHTVAISSDGDWVAWADAAGRYSIMRFPE